jgi:hypothetical protein
MYAVLVAVELATLDKALVEMAALAVALDKAEAEVVVVPLGEMQAFHVVEDLLEAEAEVALVQDVLVALLAHP